MKVTAYIQNLIGKYKQAQLEEERNEPYSMPQPLSLEGRDVAINWATIPEIFSVAIFSILMTWLLGSLAILVLSGPNNLALFIGGFLAYTCQQTHVCNFSILLPSFGFANIILLNLLFFFIYIAGKMVKREDTIDLDQLQDNIFEMFSNVNESLNDLQLKVIKLSRNEEIDPVLIKEYQTLATKTIQSQVLKSANKTRMINLAKVVAMALIALFFLIGLATLLWK